MEMIDYKPINPQIHTLLRIRSAIEDDNDLALQVTRSGKFVAVRSINDIIETLLTLDYECKIVTHEYEHYRNECIEYTNLLGGYASDGLTDKQKAELAELVKKWDEEEEAINA